MTHIALHLIPGADKAEMRNGVCCDKENLTVFASLHQSYAECQNCKCRCIHPGDDDGQMTCWTHHDCNDGSCTHQDND